MTAEVDVRCDSCESEVSKANVVNVNVNVSEIVHENGIAKDDGDSSYVFVTGGGDSITCEAPVESDLDPKQLENNDVVKVEDSFPPQDGNSHSHPHPHSLNKASDEGGSIPQIPLTNSNSDLQCVMDPKLAEEEVPVKDDASRDLDLQSENGSMPMPTPSSDQLVSDPVSKGIDDALPACHAHDSSPGDPADQNGSSQNGQALPAPVVCENGSFQVDNKSATDAVISEQNNNGDGLPTVHAQDGISQPVVTILAQEDVSDPVVTNGEADTPEENGSCENAERCDKVPIENGESFLTVADPDVANEVSLPTEDVSTCAVDDVKPQSTDAVKLNDKSSESPTPCPIEHSESEIEGVSDPVTEDTQSSCPADDTISESENPKLETESYIVLSVVDTESVPEIDSISEPNSKLEVESESAPIVDDALSSFRETDAMSELNSTSEVESVSAPVDDTLSSFPENDRITEPTSESEVESETAPIVDNALSSFQENDAISVLNSKSEVESENVPIVDDTLSSSPENESISEANSMSEVKSESAPILDDNTLSSFPANEATSEPNSKSEVESESAPVVEDNTLSSLPVNEASSEPNSKSEVESESAPAVEDNTLSSFPANDSVSELNSKSEIKFESEPTVDDTLSSLPANNSVSEPKTSHDSIGCDEEVRNAAVDVDSGLSNLEAECTASPPVCISDNNANEASLPAKPDAEDKPGSEVHNASALLSRDVPDDSNTSEYQVLNDSSVEKGIPLNFNLDDVQTESDVKSTCQVVEGTDGIHSFEASTSHPEVSNTDALEGQTKGTELEKRPFYFLIRVPRYDDENLKEQIKHAQLHVEEKTKSRDAVRSKIQMKRATCQEHFDNVEAAKSEERAARDLFRAKRQEMDTVQLMINKVKNAISVDDMDSKIRNMEHTMAHETLPLKEEKQFIREIKQLKQLREQLSSSLGKQDEVQQALDQKDHIEERSKALRKEMDVLRGNLLKAETVTQAAKKKFNEENNMLNELLSQFRAADDIRQEAYAHLQSLRKQQYDKNKYFWRYKDDAKAANNLALSGDREQLQHFCVNQVETIMELWNQNDDFRKEYIRCNNRSTLRRLRTSDGRSLGPDEEPPVIPDILRVTRDNLAPVVSTPEQAKQVASVESEKPDDKSSIKVVQKKDEIAKTKEPLKPVSSEVSPPTASGRNEIEERVEEPKLTKEEEELTRKAEELRKEEEAARLREQRRLEEKAKAKEAQERKKKIAEKAQARAAIRAQKEAEEKEKERDKRERKKERKKATTTKAANGISERETAPEPSSDIPTETPEESETRDKPMTITKRSQKSSQFTKQTKVKSIPLPLRNRSKRRMQSWMWVLLAVLVIFALFLLGNGGSADFKYLLKKFF